jgi:spore coat polysaccharide biosynthesis protein SpsF
MGRTVAIIEARMTSSRLPGKVLAPILGRPMLELLIERALRAHLLDGVIVATTNNASDDPVEALCHRLDVGCHRGSENDVLGRVLEAAQAFDVDVIVELTGDNPFTDPVAIDAVVQRYRDSGCDFAANMLERTFPLGLDIRVFSTELLRRVAAATVDPYDREHVSTYIYGHPEEFSLCNVTAPPGESAAEVRLTVDTPEDLERAREIFGRLYPHKPDFSTADVLRLIAEQPSL